MSECVCLTSVGSTRLVLSRAHMIEGRMFYLSGMDLSD